MNWTQIGINLAGVAGLEAIVVTGLPGPWKPYAHVTLCLAAIIAGLFQQPPHQGEVKK